MCCLLNHRRACRIPRIRACYTIDVHWMGPRTLISSVPNHQNCTGDWRLMLTVRRPWQDALVPVSCDGMRVYGSRKDRRRHTTRAGDRASMHLRG